MTSVSVSGDKHGSHFMLTTSDGIVADPGTLHSCAGQLS